MGGLPRPPVSCALGPRGPFSMKAGDRKRGGRGHHKRDQNSALRSPEQLKLTDRSRRVGGETEAGEEEAAGRARRPRTPRPRTPPALDLPGRTQPVPAQGPSPGRLPQPGLCAAWWATGPPGRRAVSFTSSGCPAWRQSSKAQGRTPEVDGRGEAAAGGPAGRVAPGFCGRSLLPGESAAQPRDSQDTAVGEARDPACNVQGRCLSRPGWAGGTLTRLRPVPGPGEPRAGGRQRERPVESRGSRRPARGDCRPVTPG